jgi:excisionase family DNA binding protein
MIAHADAFDALFANEPSVLTAKEIAYVMRMSHKTIYAKAADGSLRSWRCGRNRRFLKTDVIAWARNYYTPPPPRHTIDHRPIV